MKRRYAPAQRLEAPQDCKMASKNLKRWSDDNTNYCLDEANASMKCLSKNGYDKNACERYFELYKDCKKEFNGIKNERRRQGLFPNPDPEEMKELKLKKKLRLEANNRQSET